MKGILLAGGSGTRLYPLTIALSKQILPIYDKPMIYYPLSMLMMADIKDILIISTPRDVPVYQQLLGNGLQIGLNLSYKIQEQPRGIADSFIVGQDFIEGDSVALVLGDNIFCGDGLKDTLNSLAHIDKGAMILGYPVDDPTSFGVVELDSEGHVVSLEEKPNMPKSNLAIPGLYFYDAQIVDIARNLKPSLRGELEITDVNKVYHEMKLLKVTKLDSEIQWFDAGSYSGLLDAACYIKKIQDTSGKHIGCIEEIAHERGYISYTQLQLLAKGLDKTEYGQYLSSIPKC